MYLAAADIQTGISSGGGGGYATVLQQYTDDAGNSITVYSDGTYRKSPPQPAVSELSLSQGVQNLTSADWTTYLGLGLMGLAIFAVAKAL